VALENQPSFTAPSLPKMGRSTIASSALSGAGKIGSGNPKLKTSKISFQNAGSNLKIEKGGDVAGALIETNTVLVEIQKQLALDFANRIVERKDRISAIKKERDKQKKMSREASVESPLGKLSKKTNGALSKVMAPAKNIFDKIIEFLSLIGTGILVEEAFRFFSKDENRKKVEKVFNFLVDNWKILAGIFIGGKILGGILKLVGAARALRSILRRVGLIKNKGICGCPDVPGNRPNRLPRGFRTPRGNGIQMSRFFRAGPNQAPIGRMGSLINESTGRATRMLGPNKAVDVLSNLKNAGVSNANRARVLAGQLSETQALNLAKKNSGLLSGLRQNIGGIFTQTGNLGRGLLTEGQKLVGGAWKGITGFGADVMEVGGRLGKGLSDLGGTAVSGLRSTWDNIGKGLSKLDPRKLPQAIQAAVTGEIDKLKQGSPIFKKLINLVKNPKDIATLVVDLVSKAKPAVQGIKEAKRSVPFKIPGIDVLISALIAAVEIGSGAPAGNALLGALGGVLGSAAGTTLGSFAGPPGALIGAMAGGVGGELLFRAVADKIGEELAKNGNGDFGRGLVNDSPLFVSGYNPLNFGGDEKVEGKKFGGMIKGPSHGAGGVKFGSSTEVEGGEYFVNRLSASRNRAQLDDINFNQGKQILKFSEAVETQSKVLQTQEDNVNDLKKTTELLKKEFEKKKREQDQEKMREGTFLSSLLGARHEGGRGGGSAITSGRGSGEGTYQPVQGIIKGPSGRYDTIDPNILKPGFWENRPQVITMPPIDSGSVAPAVVSDDSSSVSETTGQAYDCYDPRNQYIIEAYERYGIFM